MWTLSLLSLLASTLQVLALDTQLPVKQIKWQPEPGGVYLGSPSIVSCNSAVAPGADDEAARKPTLVVSHDYFGNIQEQQSSGKFVVEVLQSSDDGNSWSSVATVEGLYWAQLFQHSGGLYLIGTTGDNNGGNHGKPGVGIAVSQDCGTSWTAPSLLFGPEDGAVWHAGPAPVVSAGGALYRAMELWDLKSNRYDIAVLMADVKSCSGGLLDKSCWSHTKALQQDPHWQPTTWQQAGANLGWQEANAIEVNVSGNSPGIAVMARVDGQVGPAFNHAALLELRAGGGQLRAPSLPYLSFSSYVPFPSASTKFVIRLEGSGGARKLGDRRYYSLTNPVSVPHMTSGQAAHPSSWQRNVLVLARSDDLRTWRVCGERPLLWDDTGSPWDNSVAMTGFHYVDWQFDGDDIIAAVRAGYRGSNSFHNSNRLLFLRIRDYRKLECEREADEWMAGLQPDPNDRSSFAPRRASRGSGTSSSALAVV